MPVRNTSRRSTLRRCARRATLRRLAGRIRIRLGRSTRSRRRGGRRLRTGRLLHHSLLHQRGQTLCPRSTPPPLPRRVSSAQASSAESCWLHDVRTLATRDLSNETSRERFTCVVAYSFVWRDSRTSVTLCTPHRPNCMLTSLQCGLLCGVEPSASVLPMRRPPHQTVRADFPHTASRVKLVSSVSPSCEGYQPEFL